MEKPKPTVPRSGGVKPSFTESSETIPGVFWNRVNSHAQKVALRYKRLGIWHELTWSEFGDEVRACAYGLMALGVQPGDKVAILAADRPEWFFADLGALSAAAVSVGIFPTSSAGQCEYVIRHSEAKVWIVDNQEQYDKVAEVRSRLPDVHNVVVIDPTGVRGIKDVTVMTFDAMKARGRKLEEERPKKLKERLQAIDPDSTAFIIYTSGTTGPPKGAMHSHRNFLQGAASCLDAAGTREDDEGICYLPLAHIMERVSSYSSLLLRGASGSCAESTDTLLQDLKEVSPTGFQAVPRTWEKLKAGIELRMAESTWLKRRAYAAALQIGFRWRRNELSGQKPGIQLQAARFAAELTILRKLRERLGLHRIRAAFSGAAPIAPEVIDFFRAIGVPLREGYGQTETGVTVITPANDVRVGKIGVPVKGAQFRVGENGELLCKTPGVMKGYFKDPEGTDKVLKDGWFHSGDQGSIDADDYVQLTGRVKDMMITAAGRNIAPQRIENMLKASNYIMDAVLVGEGQPYLTALIALDEETVSDWAQNHNVAFSSFADLASQPEVVELIDGEVRKVNAQWSDREQILDFRILQWELSYDEEELTPTLKVRRKIICEKYSGLIEEMYAKATV
jgi:long-chain acyl-CoA synthetase